MINEVCTEPRRSPDPQYCTHNYMSHMLKRLDGYLFANVPDILHTTHNYNSDTILYSHFLQCALDFICIAPAVVLLWLLSSILRKYIIILTPHLPLEASLVGC